MMAIIVGDSSVLRPPLAAGLAVLGVNAPAAAFLINAGLVKLIAPGRLREALRELLAVAVVTSGGVRLLASVEIAVGVALLTAPARGAAAVGVAGLALSFVLLGVAGRL